MLIILKLLIIASTATVVATSSSDDVSSKTLLQKPATLKTDSPDGSEERRQLIKSPPTSRPLIEFTPTSKTSSNVVLPRQSSKIADESVVTSPKDIIPSETSKSSGGIMSPKTPTLPPRPPTQRFDSIPIFSGSSTPLKSNEKITNPIDGEKSVSPVTKSTTRRSISSIFASFKSRLSSPKAQTTTNSSSSSSPSTSTSLSPNNSNRGSLSPTAGSQRVLLTRMDLDKGPYPLRSKRPISSTKAVLRDSSSQTMAVEVPPSSIDPHAPLPSSLLLRRNPFEEVVDPSLSRAISKLLPPLDSVLPFPLDVHATGYKNTVIIRYMQGAQRALDTETLVHWNFSKKLDTELLQFTFLPPSKINNRIGLVIINQKKIAYTATAYFVATTEPMLETIEFVQGESTGPVRIPLSNSGKKATTVLIQRRKDIYRALSKGQHLYFVLSLRSIKEHAKKIDAIMPKQPIRIPIPQNVVRSRSLSAITATPSTTGRKSLEIDNDIFVRSSSLVGSVLSSIEPPARRSSHSSVIPFERPYTEIKMIRSHNIPLSSYIGEWSALTFSTTDKLGHNWEFIVSIKQKNIEVVAFNRDIPNNLHFTVHVAFFVSEHPIDSANNLQNAIRVCKHQGNFSSLEAPILTLGPLDELRRNAINMSKFSYVYFAHGIHPFTPKPTIEDLAGALELQVVGSMPHNIRKIVLKWLLNEDEYAKLFRTVRSLSLIDTRRLNIKGFRSRNRSVVQSPPPRTSLDDDYQDDDFDGTIENLDDDDDEDEAETPQILQLDTSSAGSRGFETWFGNDPDYNDPQDSKQRSVRFQEKGPQ